MRACLSEAKVVEILKKNFVVVSNNYPQHNNTSFGVMAWVSTPDKQELNKYFIGTGNAEIGRVFTAKSHEARVAGTEKFLNEALKKWEELKPKETPAESKEKP